MGCLKTTHVKRDNSSTLAMIGRTATLGSEPPNFLHARWLPSILHNTVQNTGTGELN